MQNLYKEIQSMIKSFSTFLVALTVSATLTPQATAHSGRTDSNGGHNCSEASQRKGLCYGYHYHNSIDLKKANQRLVEATYRPFQDDVEAEHDNYQENSSVGSTASFEGSY